MAKATMQDIADALNTSRITVWKALNNRPGVSAALRAENQRKAQELGYTKGGTPAAAAVQPAAPAGTRTVSVVVSRPESSLFWMQIVHRLARELTVQGWNLMYTYLPAYGDESYTLPSALTDGSVSGVIVHQAQPRALRGIGRRPVHAHHFDFQIPYHEIAAIGDDDGIPRIPEEGSFPLPVRRKSDGIILRTGNICDREIAERVPAAEQNTVPRGKLRLKRLGVDRSQIERRGFAQSVVRGRAFGGYIKYPPRAQGIGRFLPFQLRFERILRIGGSVRHALVCRIFPRFFLSAACHSRTSAYRQNAQKYR